MDKSDVIVLLKECFETEGNCVFLHFVDGSELLVQSKPNFFNLTMCVDIEYDKDKDMVVEKCYIPYSSILYLTVSTFENVKLMISKYGG